MALDVRGLMNVQFAVKDGEVYLIEVNPRASRTVPFVAKAIGQPVAKIAARVMAGEKLADFPPFKRDLDYMAVKEAVFPFARFPGVRSGAEPGNEIDRRSHGDRPRFPDRLPQVADRRGHGPAARAAWCSSRSRTATSRSIVPAVQQLIEHGFTVIATGGTAEVPCRAGLAGRAGQQGRRRAPAYRRPDHRRRYRADLQHHRGLAEPQGQPIDPRIGAGKEGALLHHGRGISWLRRRRSRRLTPSQLEVRSLQDYYS